MPIQRKRVARKGIEVSFDWIFAIIVGAIVIILGVYAAVRFVGSESTGQNTQNAKALGTIMNPIEAGFGDSKVVPIEFSTQIKIFNGCDTRGTFGKQKISTELVSKIKNSQQGLNVSFANKYLFSEKMIQGKKFIAFSEGFNMPFKVADLIFMWSLDQKYCFVFPELSDSQTKDEIMNLKSNNINVNLTIDVKESTDDCSKNSKIVCFDSTMGAKECDITVYTDNKIVRRKGAPSNDVYYEDSLIYGAIFSDPGVYKCEVVRLMKRASELASLYKEKATYFGGECGDSVLTDQGSNLDGYISLTQDATDANLDTIKNYANDLNNLNPEAENCKLWKER